MSDRIDRDATGPNIAPDQVPDLDDQYLLARYSKSFVYEMFTLFLEVSEQRMIDLNRGIEESDLEVIEDVAHSLAGASGTIRAMAVSNQSRLLQKAALDKDMEACRVCHRSLVGDMKRLTEALKNSSAMLD